MHFWIDACRLAMIFITPSENQVRHGPDVWGIADTDLDDLLFPTIYSN